MKVALLSLEWPRAGHHAGGVGRYSYRLAAQLRDLVDLTVVARHNALPLPGVQVIELPRSSSRLGRYYRDPVRSRGLLRDVQPDIVHAHGDDWALSKDVPIVRTFHGDAWREASTSRGLRRYNHLLLGALERWSALRVTTKIGIAPESQKTFGCDVIVPPILSIERAVARRMPTHSPTAVFIGAFNGRKRGHLAQLAVARAREILQREIRLVVIGPREDARLWDASTEHRSGLSDDEVTALLSEAWLLLAPSEYEGFGLPTIEALSLGVPVVATPNPGNEFFLRLGGESLPMEIESDMSLLAETMARRIESGPVLQADEQEAAARLLERLCADGDPARLVQIYERCLSTTN